MTKIGFIGQGWIGKHYADDFEARLYEVVRYALEEPYAQNKEAITECNIVFIAVPTPTTPDGYSYEPVISALSCLKEGTTAVIKSTLAPGTTQQLQEQFPDLFVLHSPEFLREATAAYDAAKPQRNLIGIPTDNTEFKKRAESVLRILPEAPFASIMSAKEAELVKYAGNCFLYTKVIFMNMLHDLVGAQGANWEIVREAMINDPRIGKSHTQPVHFSGHEKDTGEEKRGAGGHCFIKDFEAFRQLYSEQLSDEAGSAVLLAMVHKNNELLISSNKDLELLKGVYGEDITVST
jgi:UDPglucose 6-dehydrogenase